MSVTLAGICAQTINSSAVNRGIIPEASELESSFEICEQFILLKTTQIALAYTFLVLTFSHLQIQVKKKSLFLNDTDNFKVFINGQKLSTTAVQMKKTQ